MQNILQEEAGEGILVLEDFRETIKRAGEINEEEILKEYLRLTEKSAERMREKGLAANTISIKVRFSDFKTISRSKTLDLPINSTQEIFEVVKNLYLALGLERVLIRLVGVSLDSLVENDDLQQMVLGQRESGWAQASYDPFVPYGEVGPTLVSHD